MLPIILSLQKHTKNSNIKTGQSWRKLFLSIKEQERTWKRYLSLLLALLAFSLLASSY